MTQRTRCLSLVLMLSAAALGGCSFNVASRDQMIRNNPTPELTTLYQRPVDVSNQTALTFNSNWRMFWQDLGRAAYWDRPSRMTREPIPH